MNEIEKSVDEIFHKTKLIIDDNGVIILSNVRETNKELTDYITGLLDKVVPEEYEFEDIENRNENIDIAIKILFNLLKDKIKQNIAKLKGEE